MARGAARPGGRAGVSPGRREGTRSRHAGDFSPGRPISTTRVIRRAQVVFGRHARARSVFRRAASSRSPDFSTRGARGLDEPNVIDGRLLQRATCLRRGIGPAPPPALRLRGTRSSRRCRRTLCSRVLSPGSPSAAGLPGSAAVRAPPSPDTALWRRVRAAPASAARATRAGTGTGARSLPRSFARAAAAADPPECTAPGAPWT